jgi:acetyl esterase/lipase
MSDDILTLPSPPADARLSYGSDPNQFLDLRLPKSKGPHPTVINLHGGFWRAKYSLDHAGHLCAALTAKGLATANVEYRRVGNESGGWPNTFADVRGAYQFLRQDAKQYDLDAQKFVVMGHSAGAQLAFCLAAHETSLRRVVSLAGVVDLQRAYQLHLSNNAVVEFLHGTPTEVPDHYREADPMQLSIPQGSEWLIHGGVDDIVPPAFSRDYVASKQKRSGKDREDVQLLEIPAAGHFELIDPRTQAWKQVQQTVMRLLT